MSDILCVTNRTLCETDFLQQIEALAACHPLGILLREKDLSPASYQELARQVLAVCRRYDTLCILHSFVDVAAELNAAAIHLPLPRLRELSDRQKAGFSCIGASCHSVQDAVEAERLGCTYLTAGHIFATDCKKGLPGRGLDFLRDVVHSTKLPVYAIGGIDCRTIGPIRMTGAKGACVMSGAMRCRDAADYLRSLEG